MRCGEIGVLLRDRAEQVGLLLLGLHGQVGGLEVVEVADRPIGRLVGRRPLQHHLLVELVDRADLVPGLDADQQPQRLLAVAVRADAQPGVQAGGERGVAVMGRQTGERRL